MNKEIEIDVARLHLIPHGEGKSRYAIEASQVLVDVSKIIKDLSADKVSLQEAVDWLSDRHFNRTSDWDEVSQMSTDSLFNGMMVKIFGKPINV